MSAPAEKWENLLFSRSTLSSGLGKASGWGLVGFKFSFKDKSFVELTQTELTLSLSEKLEGEMILS